MGLASSSRSQNYGSSPKCHTNDAPRSSPPPFPHSPTARICARAHLKHNKNIITADAEHEEWHHDRDRVDLEATIHAHAKADEYGENAHDNHTRAQ